MFNVEKIWNSLCSGYLSIAIFWIFSMLAVLFFSIGQSETFTIVGWICCTVFYAILALIHTVSKVEAVKRENDKPYLKDDKIRRIGEIVAAYEHKHYTNVNIETICQHVRENLVWIRGNNTMSNKEEIDERLDDMDHRLQLLAISLSARSCPNRTVIG